MLRDKSGKALVLARASTRTARRIFLASGMALPAASSAADVAAPKRIAAAGKIVYCSDMTGPPLEFLDENTKPVGSDIDLGDEIAKRFGVKVEWNNIPFNGLVPRCWPSNAMRSSRSSSTSPSGARPSTSSTT